MTREQAINYLRSSGFSEEQIQEIVKALEQEPVLDKIRAEIEKEYKVESEHPYGEGLRRALKIIDKYKAETENT
jgi:DNA-binding transcriptional MerR regulator